MATPKTDHDKRYRDLLKDMEKSVAAVESRERELLQAAGQLKGMLDSTPGVSTGVKAGVGDKLDLAYSRIERLQKRRSETMQRMLTKAETTFREMMKVKADQDLPHSKNVLGATRQQLEFSNLLKAIQRSLSRQVNASLDLQRSTDQQLKEIRQTLTDSLVAVVNKALQENQQPQADMVASAVIRAQGVVPKASNDPAVPETSPKLGAPARALSSAKTKNTAQKHPANVKSSKESDEESGGVYKDIQTETLNRRVVRALEVLATRRYTQTQGSLALLGAAGATGLASVLGDVWAPLKAFAAAMNPARILERLKGMFTAVESKIRTILDFVHNKVSTALEWAKGKAAELVEKGGKFLNTIGEKLGIVKSETSVAQSASNAAKALSAPAKPATFVGRAIEVVKSGARAVGSTAMEGAKWAGSQAVTGAKWAGGQAMEIGGKTAAAISKLGAKGYQYVKNAGSAVMDSLARMGSSPAAQFIGKWANRLGNIGMLYSTISGIYEEANGKRVNDIDVWEAIFNPMQAGRFLGSKFNDYFKKLAGQDLGGWLYDMTHSEAGFAQATQEWAQARLAENAQMPSSSTRVAPRGPTPVTPAAPSSPTTSVRPRSGPSTSGKGAGGVNPQSIPDSLGNDYTLMGINGHLFHGGA